MMSFLAGRRLKLAAALTCLAASAAQAEWTPYVETYRDNGTVNLTGFTSVTKPTPVSGMSGAIQSLYTELRSKTTATINQELAKQDGYVSSSATFTGPLNIVVDPQTGYLATLSGFKISFNARFNVSYGFLKYSCSSYLSTSPITLSAGTFDSPTGRYYNLQVTNTSSNSSVTCESNLSWVPFLGWMIDRAGSLYGTSALQSAWQTALNTPKVFQAPSYMALDKTIQNLTYVSSSTDIGARFRDNLQNYFNASKATIFIQDPSYTPMPTSQDWDSYFQAVNPPPVQIADPRFSITFTSPGFNAGFKWVRTNTYKARWTCPRTQPTCGQPPL